MSFLSGNKDHQNPDSDNSKKQAVTTQPSPNDAPKMTNESFGAAYQKGFPLTLRFLISRGLSHETAVDTAQAAWTKSWERREQLREPKLVITWTNSIALNIYRTMLRRERPTEPLSEVQASTSLNIAIIDVERILNECKPSDRAILEERYFGGYKTQEIAQSQGCSVMAARIRLFRAHKKILRDLNGQKARRPLAIVPSLLLNR